MAEQMDKARGTVEGKVSAAYLSHTQNSQDSNTMARPLTRGVVHFNKSLDCFK